MQNMLPAFKTFFCWGKRGLMSYGKKSVGLYLI